MIAAKQLVWLGLGAGIALSWASPSGSWAQETGSGAPPYTCGYLAPAFDHPCFEAKMAEDSLMFPVRFDWRQEGVVTPVQNQGSCNSCYVFAALANFESKMMVDGEGSFDFSENNVKECQWYPNSCYTGGNYWRVANFLSKQGTVLESCDPYASYMQYSCKDTCPHIKTLLDWRVISFGVTPDPEVLKSYIYDYGPVFVAMDGGISSQWRSEFGSYDGSYTLYHPSSTSVNHAVLIIGWDDDLVHAGGTGAWIVKNSWGTSWGGPCGYGTEGGYFTIAYGSANIGQQASFLYEWQDYDPDGELLYYDEGGYSVLSGEGYPGSTTAWGLCKYVPASNGSIERVEFFAVDAMTDVDVYVYDDFTGGSLSNLLTSRLDVSFAHPGYHSVELTTPVGIYAGDDIYVVAKFTSATFEGPLPADRLDPHAAGMCYKSPNGNTWYEMLDDDLGIRIRVAWDEAAPGPAGLLDPAGGERGGQAKLTCTNLQSSRFAIRYVLSEPEWVQLEVYDVMGRRVAILREGFEEGGPHSIAWEPGAATASLSPGLYFVRLVTSREIHTAKLVLIE
jgi:C1A family cysteine protease